MRVLVATDRIGALTSAQAGAVLAGAWPAESASVIPIGEAGNGFSQAYADQRGLPLEVAAGPDGVVALARSEDLLLVALELPGVVTGPIPYEASTELLGHTLQAALTESSAATVVVDLSGLDAHDGGAGFLGALGAVADAPLHLGVSALSGVSTLDLAPCRALLAGRELIGVVPSAEVSLPLLGLRGITARRGRAAGDDPARLVATDATLERLARLAGPEFANWPGTGACGGLGFAVLALGGRLTTGPALAFQTSPAPPVDLVVTGCDRFDFASRGGGVVAAVAERAAQLLAPCIAIAGEVYVGAREMRTMGIEAAYAVREAAGTPPALVSEPELAATVQRVARSWQW